MENAGRVVVPAGVRSGWRRPRGGAAGYFLAAVFVELVFALAAVVDFFAAGLAGGFTSAALFAGRLGAAAAGAAYCVRELRLRAARA
jgi:hypothetical protein